MQHPLPIYRFTFRPTFVSLLRDFSILHQHDCCKDFQEAIAEWKTCHAVAIQEEKSYLQSLGYVGDFHSKIYKSARYYLARMDRSVGVEEEAPEQPPPDQKRVEKETEKKGGQRKPYTSISTELSAKIAEYLDQEEHCRLKPSDAFALFCQAYREETIQEIKRLRREEAEAEAPAEREVDDPLENKQELLKIKKTFKNKHFMKKKISLSCFSC